MKQLPTLLLSALAVAPLSVLAQAPTFTYEPWLTTADSSAAGYRGATAEATLGRADAAAPTSQAAPATDAYAGRDIAVSTYVAWRGADTTSRSRVAYTSPRSSGDDYAYDFERVYTSPDNQPDLVTRGTYRFRRDPTSGRAHAREEATRAGGPPYWGFVETTAPLAARGLTRKVRRPLDSLRAAVPEPVTSFDSVAASAGRYESYFGSGTNADSSATPAALCPYSSVRFDTLALSGTHTRTRFRYTYYQECEWQYYHDRIRHEFRDGAGALVRSVDTATVVIRPNPNHTHIGPDTVITAESFRRDGATMVVRREITHVYEGLRPEVTIERTENYDDEGRLLSARQPAYQMGTDLGGTATYYGYDETHVYGADRHERTNVNTDMDGQPVSGSRTVTEYRPLATGLVERGAKVSCDVRTAPTPAGLAVTAAHSGTYRAYDFSGRAVWTAAALAGETLEFRPEARGVYAVQGPRGCAVTAVW